LRRIALPATRLARATAGTIRLRLLKLGAPVRVSVRTGHDRRGQLRCPSLRGIGQSPMASGHPWQQDWAIAHQALIAAAG
jgi:hypothetical protein